MPKARKKSNCVPDTDTNESPEEFNNMQESFSENEVHEDYNRSQDSGSDNPEIFFNPQPSTSQKVRDIPNINMYMPYIVGPDMDWTVNDGLYNRFLKWKLKCENILECELAILPEARKCKKVLAWSGDFGLDQYTSWNLPNEELSLETIWEKFEEFCKPQANELRARFDLLTSFRQADMSVDEWYNAVQTQVALSKYPPGTAQILQRDIFWFFLKDESFVSKTLNEGHVELEKFPASKVRQMAKKLESSQSTARHIKKMSSEPQANQIHLLKHQRIDLPPSKFQRKQNKKFKQRNLQTRNIKKISTEKEGLKQKKDFTRIHKNIPVLKTDVPSVVTAHI